MTDNENKELYGNFINDVNCGTFILASQYVDKLLAKYTDVYRRKLRRIKRAIRKEKEKMNDIENRAREYLAEHSEYSEVFGGTFVAVDTLTAMVEFVKQENKRNIRPTNKATENFVGALNRESAELSIFNEVLENKCSKAKELLQKCLNTYIRDPDLRSEIEEFLKEV